MGPEKSQDVDTPPLFLMKFKRSSVLPSSLYFPGEGYLHIQS